MLHWARSLKFGSIFFILMLFIWSVACKQDTSSQSEDEAAYMADYEAPSDHWGFIDTTGNLVIEPKYDEAGPFAEGLAAVNEDGKWGFIDPEGKLVIAPVYKSAWAFHEGFARVLPFDGPDQFIDKNGNPIKADNWAAADDFADGRARVKVGNIYGYIDAKGELLIQPIFTRGWNFSNGICIVEYQDMLGVIGKDGKYILPPEYDQIKKTADDKILLCRKANNAVAFDIAGKEILKINNAKMTDSNGQLISVRENNKMYLLKIADPAAKSLDYSNIIYLEQDMWAG